MRRGDLRAIFHGTDTRSRSWLVYSGGSAIFGICTPMGPTAPTMIQPFAVRFSADWQPITSLNAVFTLKAGMSVQVGLCAESALGTFDYLDQGVTTVIVTQ